MITFTSELLSSVAIDFVRSSYANDRLTLHYSVNANINDTCGYESEAEVTFIPKCYENTDADCPSVLIRAFDALKRTITAEEYATLSFLLINDAYTRFATECLKRSIY